VRRAPGRARYDRDALDAVLDAGWIAHVAFAVDGEPFVVPMVYARDGDRLLIHGSVASRAMRHADAGFPVSVAVTHVDGLVLARSAFHHSVNYRSAVVRGIARRVTDPDELAAGFRRLVDHAVPGRSAEVREPDGPETRQTMLLAVDVTDAAVKSRSGGPIDDEADLALPVWAGVVPLRTEAGAPRPADDLPTDVAARVSPPDVVTVPGRATAAG
jgi:nitroimidazol reductase NimA-like FMN-containing flavoprotein (pyridoxamine 5'-phosphate oxidase superfamily)